MQKSKENEPAISNAQEKQSENKTNGRTGRSWRALFNFTTRSDIQLLLCAISCSMASSVGGPAQAFIIGKVFDLLISVAAGSVSGEDFLQQESRWILYLVAIGGGSWLLHALEYTCWITFGERQARNARLQLYHTLSHKDISWFESSDDSDGSALARYIAQIQELQLAVSQPFRGFLSLITTAVLAVAQAFYNSWDLTLVTLAGSPIVALVIMFFGSGMQKGIDNQNTALKEANSRSLAALSAIETVKCFVAEHFELKQYRVHVLEASKHYRGIVIRNALQMGSLTFLIQAMFVQAFYYGGVLIHRGSRNASQVVTTFFSAIAAFQAVQGILPQMLVLEKGRAAGHDLFDLIQQGQETDANARVGRLRPLDCAGSIQFSRVSFRYPGAENQLVLKHIDLLIRAREITFIIGQSGSGKSTIGQLLVQFYTSYSGIITLDGNDLNALDLRWLRSNVFLVEQNSTLFNQTIGENIALGSYDIEGVVEADINAAAEFALLQAMLADVPKGLDTIIDSEGGTISGGQRQRIALARARFRNAPVLILDESTSALDQINRSLMMAAIRTWRRGKTTIVITHDLTQIEQSDHVYVLDQGKVVQDRYRQQMQHPNQQVFDKMKSLPRLPRQLKSSMTASSLSDDLAPSTTLAAASAFMQNVPAMSMLPMWTNKRASIRPAARTENSTKQSSTSTAVSWRPYHLPFFGQSRSEWLIRQPSEQTKIMTEYINKTGNTAVQSRRHGMRTERLQHDEAVTLEMEDSGATLVISHSMSETLKVLWHDSAARMRALLLLGFWSATIHAVCLPIFAFVLSKLLKLYAIPTDTSHQALTYSLAIIAIAVADAIHTYGYRYFLEMASQLWVDKLRTRAMQSLLRQPISYFESEETSVTAITHILDHDAEEMRNLVGRFIGMIYIAIATIVTSFIWALSTEWKMTLFAITAAPYILLVTSIYSAVTERWEGTSHEAVKASDLIFLETFKNIRTVRVLTAERRFEKRFNKAVGNTLNIGRRRAIVTGILYGMSTSATTFATAMVFYIGSRLIHDGADVSAVLQVFTVLIFTISNVSAILDYVPQLGTAKDTAWRLLSLTNLPSESHEQGGTTQISSVGDVTLTRLKFAYPSRPDAVVLSDIDLTVQRSLVTAIVGASGSGKSTIAKLILKLHEARSESLASHSKASPLTVNGRAIEKLSTASLRRMIAVVPQSSPIFSSSIRHNITYGLDEASAYNKTDNIMAAARLAGIHDLIQSMPQGYETMIGHGGRGLSGGQSQRIAIARALIRQPKLLILDEATSALDPESAKLIRQTVVELKNDTRLRMTILIITHSRDMMELADHVVVLDRGVLMEQGGFADLIRNEGHLTNLLNSGILET